MVLSLDSLPGTNPTWSFPIIEGRRGRRRFAKILANNLRSTLSREFGLQLATDVASFPSFGMTVICASSNLWKGMVIEVRELNAFKNWAERVSMNVLK